MVVGDQSHGKSSIIEAVCDITLPRSEGTCTRCPFSITTTGSKATKGWICKISLGGRFSYNPNAKSQQWERTGAQNAVEFATVTDKSMLDHTLRLAQLAILNPHMDPADILRANNLEMGTIASFSPNVISLEVAADEMPELSLIDLPGAINIAENSDEQHLVGLIEKLIKALVKDDKALILLAVAANCDTDTSTAFKFVDQCKARDRCVGVLTKPDLMTRSHQQVRRILNGEVFQLGNGWFVAKQPSQEELDNGFAYADAREREMAFFDQHPWSTSLVDFGSRFGIPSLQGALSRKLTDHILDYLPDINRRVENRLEEVGSQLAGFPEQSKAPCLAIFNDIERVNAAITARLQRDSLNNEFRDSYGEIIRSLREQLKQARPQLLLTTPGVKQRAVPIAIDSSDDDEAPASPAPMPSKKARKGNDGRVIAAYRTPVKTENGSPAPPVKAIFRLDQIKQAYDRGWTCGLPDEINPKVTEHLVLQSVSGWSSLVDGILEDVRNLVLGMISTGIDTSLATRRQTKLFTETSIVVESLFSALMGKQQDLVRNFIACETYQPITYAGAALKQGIETTRQQLRGERTQQRINEYYDTLECKGAKPTKPEDRKKKLGDSDWIQRSLGSDPYAREVGAVARILAYYDIASQRVVDVIASHLEYGLLHGLENNLKSALFEGLQATNSEYCAQLLAEDPQREALRLRLMAEKEKLLQALEELRGLPHLN